MAHPEIIYICIPAEVNFSNKAKALSGECRPLPMCSVSTVMFELAVCCVVLCCVCVLFALFSLKCATKRYIKQMTG